MYIMYIYIYIYIHIKANVEKRFSSSSSAFPLLVWYTNVDIFVTMYIDRRMFARHFILDRPLRQDLVFFFSATFVYQHDK
jgi:hypothetical protein